MFHGEFDANGQRNLSLVPPPTGGVGVGGTTTGVGVDVRVGVAVGVRVGVGVGVRVGVGGTTTGVEVRVGVGVGVKVAVGATGVDVRVGVGVGVGVAVGGATTGVDVAVGGTTTGVDVAVEGTAVEVAVFVAAAGVGVVGSSSPTTVDPVATAAELLCGYTFAVTSCSPGPSDPLFSTQPLSPKSEYGGLFSTPWSVPSTRNSTRMSPAIATSASSVNSSGGEP
jgi:hypothetical protein